MQPRIYLDANVFIYFVEGELAVAAAVRELFVVLEGLPSRAVTSELTLAEVLAPPRSAAALSLPLKRQRHLDLIIQGGFVHLEPVSRDILIDTSGLRIASSMKLADAIHIASAARCDCVRTNGPMGPPDGSSTPWEVRLKSRRRYNGWRRRRSRNDR